MRQSLKETRKFKQFYCALTNRCNLQCIMCTTTRHPHEVEEELGLGDWQAILSNVLRFNVESIAFGGGEPLLRRDDLAALCSQVAQQGVMVNIVTNATLLSEDLLNKLECFKEKVIFLLSLDGLKSENDRIRGEGVFERVMAASGLLAERGWPFFVTSVLMPENFTGFVDFLRFHKSHFPQTLLDIQPVIPHNEVYHLRKSFELTEPQTRALDEILRFLRQDQGALKLCRPLAVIEKYRDYFHGVLKTENACKMGSESFNINLRGNLWVCGHEIEKPLHRFSLEDVLSDEDYLCQMRRVTECQSPCLAGLVL